MLGYIMFSNESSELASVFMIVSIFSYLISLSFHEFAHAFTATKMGDNTPKSAGRLTLNPFRHLDLMGFLCFILIGIGWAKPVPINPVNFKKYRTGTRLVSISGILTNFMLGLIAAVTCLILSKTVGFNTDVMVYVYLFLLSMMLVNSFLALFNLLPIYPFDGFKFICTFMKTENGFIRYSLKNGFKIMLGIIIICSLTQIMFGFDILDWYLSILYNYVFIPIAGV